MGEIIIIQDNIYEQFDKAFRQIAKDFFKEGEVVCLKLHMGEGKGHFDVELARMAVRVLLEMGCEPFLFDTTTVYQGNRYTVEDYLKTAEKHGFSTERIDCPIYIDNDSVEEPTEHLTVKVAKRVADADALLVLTHVKGHDSTGAGASIKNIGMGCVHPYTKKDMHDKAIPVLKEELCTGCGNCEKICSFGKIEFDGKPRIHESCWGCGVCADNCPENALNPSVERIETLLCEATKAVLDRCNKVLYVNDARSITKFCDCLANPGPKIANDVGVFIGKDIVAIDKAAIDMIIKENGDVFQEILHKDALVQIDEGARLGLGEKEYELVWA